MLIRYLPTNVVLYLAAPYLAGQTSKEALTKAKTIWQAYKFTGTLDVLGEESTSVEQCQSYVTVFKNLIDLVRTNPLPNADKRHQLTISFKPSMFCISKLGAPLNQKSLDEAFERITEVVDYGAKNDIRMTIEAEEHHWTDFHLSSYFSLLDLGYSNLGTVLQSRLFRTAQDIKRFDQRCRVRLVTGIYAESSQIAYTANKPIKEALLNYSGELLGRGAYVELASHDQYCIKTFFKTIILPLSIPASQFETQFLLGIPRLVLQQMLVSGKYFQNWSGNICNATERSHLETLSRSGILVRLYLPFGPGSIASPYCKRRLEHNPNLIIYGIKNILGI